MTSNTIVRNTLTFSAILPATVLFIFTIIMLKEMILNLLQNQGNGWIALFMTMGIVGYIGLWRNLIFPNKSLMTTTILLSIGLLAGIFFIVFVGGKAAIWYIITLEEPGETIIFIWPLIAAKFLIAFNIKKLYDDKRSKAST